LLEKRNMSVRALVDADRFLFRHTWAPSDVDDPIELLRELSEYSTELLEQLDRSQHEERMLREKLEETHGKLEDLYVKYNNLVGWVDDCPALPRDVKS
jgi:hypothetical protein